jgi:hypothetical protein
MNMSNLKRLGASFILGAGLLCPFFSYAAVLISQPYAGQWSGAHSIHYESGFIQPIGFIPETIGGFDVTTVSVYLHLTPINNNGGGSLRLIEWASQSDALTSGSAVPLQTCIFSNNSFASGVTYDGFYDFSGTCTLDAAGYWTMNVSTAQHNWDNFKMQGQSGFFTGVATVVYNGNDSTFYANGAGDGIGALWFQLKDAQEAVDGSFLLIGSTTPDRRFGAINLNFDTTSCNPVSDLIIFTGGSSSPFSLNDCLNTLIGWPDIIMRQEFAAINTKLLYFWPLGYISRFVAIVSGTATSTIPSPILRFPNSIGALDTSDLNASTTINIQGSVNTASAFLNTPIDEGSLGSLTFFAPIMVLWTLFCYLSLFSRILYDLVHPFGGAPSGVAMKDI